MKVSILALVFLCLLPSINSAWGVTWSDIARFSEYWGTAPNVLREKRTDNFTCNYAEWRIVWNYTPLSTVDPENVYFNILIYRTNETNYITSMNQQGNTTTNGTMYINNQTGEFYLKFLVYNVLEATAVIEQDIQTAPEFSPLVLLSLFATGTLVAIILSRRRLSKL